MVMMAFYKGKGTLFDRLIRIWTRSSYSHCEYFFGDGQFFSADPRSGGVRYKSIDIDTEKWDYKAIDVDAEQEKVIRGWCNNQVGKKYDWLGIFLSQILPLNIQEPNKWFCSEICSAGLKQVGLLEGVKPSSVNPGKLFKLLGGSLVGVLLSVSVALAAPTAVNLIWDANTEANLSGYNVYCSTVNAVPFKWVSTVTLNAATVSLDLSTQDNYCAVTAFNSYALESDYSNILTIYKLVKPGNPKNLRK